MKIKIDKYGNICENGEYTVTLNGSYQWHFMSGKWEYEVEKVEPKLPIKYIYSEKELTK